MRAVQAHMCDRGHCKLLYEDGGEYSDLGEYTAFYDFSNESRDLALAKQRIKRREVVARESAGARRRRRRRERKAADGKQSEKEHMEKEVGMDEDDDRMHDDDDLSCTSGAHINDIGELVLPDGRTVGHRDYSIFYKQNLVSAHARECREAIQM